MPTVIVTTPAADRRLCDAAALKIELGIDADDTRFDGWLAAEGLSASDRVAEACGVVGDDEGDAPPTFAEEVGVITFASAEAGGDTLILPWRHPARVTAVTVGGVALDPALYWAESKAGLLIRQGGRWGGAPVAVTVRSGWAADKIPTALQDAVKRLVRLRWEAKDRELAVKAEQTDGTGRTEYWVGSMGASGSALPADVLAALQAGGFANRGIA